MPPRSPRSKNAALGVQSVALRQQRYRSGQFLEALRQLSDNAAHFTPEGGLVSVSTYQLDDHLSIEIRDTGCGIADADLPKIFNRFFRLDNAHTSAGFGLGLPLARRIVEMHGGSISVTSQIGRGSTFRITLPIGKADPRDEGFQVERTAPA
ncbi:MAG: sensor histidine kinase [Chloroflexi bacterium]|nr:sensor histidine kinase [Chloroflexota bacterium]